MSPRSACIAAPGTAGISFACRKHLFPLLKLSVLVERLLQLSLIALLAFLTLAGGHAHAEGKPASLTVVIDDNYPPYIFRDADGTLNGYLVDLWHLWERRTGVSVQLQAGDWSKALKTMTDGKADVIDTIFETEERRHIFDFSSPYADIPVGLYVHTDIGGIADLKTLQGFVVGVKAGDACGQQLADANISTLTEFSSYEQIVEAAISHKIRIFCLDEPPANYLLYRAGADRAYRKAFSLSSGQFHRAFRKNDDATRALVENGFSAIPQAQIQNLKDKWFGPRTGRDVVRLIQKFIPFALAITLGLLAWNFTLRRQVRHRTGELNKERLRLDTLFHAIPDLVWLKDPEGIYVTCNAEFERFFGAPKDRIIGKTDYDFVPKDLADFFRQKDREALVSDTPRLNTEWVTYANGGPHVLLEVIKTPIRDHDGQILGVLGIARNITQMHQAQLALKEIQERFEIAFRASPVAAAICQASDGTFVDINTRFAQNFGWSRDELLLQNPNSIGLWPDGASYRRWLATLHRDRALHDWNVQWQDSKGSIRWMSVSASLIELQGNTCILAHAIDITARQIAEDLLEGQRRILEMIATGIPLDQTLHALARMAEDQAPGMLASIQLTSEDGQLLRHGVAPSLPPSFVSAIADVPIGPGMGSCGTAAFLREQVIVEDIAIDPQWASVRELALECGLRACWSTPFFDDAGKVLGTFALYFRHPGRPGSHELRLIAAATQAASIAIVRQREDAALRTSETYNKLFFADSNMPQAVLDPVSNQFLDCNDAAARVYGLSGREALIGKTPLDLSPRHQYDAAESENAGMRILDRCMIEGEQVFEWQHRRPDGTLWDAEVRLTRFEFEERKLVQVTLRDITAEKRSEESLRLAAKVFESTDEGITIADSKGTIVAVNRAFTAITGYSAQEVIGENPRILSSGIHDNDFYTKMWSSLSSHGQWQGEIWNKNKDGRIYPEWMTISSVKNSRDETTHYVAVFSDISALKQTENALEHQAHHDHLTGLPNRKLLRDRLEHALHRAARTKESVAVIFIDLDRFKNVNDTLGHSIGDALLQSVAERMVGTVRAADTLARWGGDEFVLLLEEDVTCESAEIVARKILGVFRHPFKVEHLEIDITASVGVSLFPDFGKDIDALLAQADMAMYQAKADGRNAFQFYETRFGAGAEERMRIETALRRAVQRGEMLLHFQPQVSLVSGSLVGVEALVRWQHPELGLVSPARFVPIAEEIGAIQEIGAWVLREACRQFSLWISAGIPVPRISVNLSAQQLEDQELPKTVERLLAEFHLSSSQLELEVTESSLMRQTESVARVLEGLRALNLELSIDDFGTGYSSLAYLKRLPVHRLKIDRSFVKDIGLDASDETLVRAITTLGRSLSLELIAEGVEREDQIAFLRAAGCHVAQGYYFGQPMPPALFVDYVNSQQGAVLARSE